MNRKSIVILILLAAIFAAVIFSLQKKEPFIEKVIISDQKNLSEAQQKSLAPGPKDDFILYGDSGIYAIFIVKDFNTENIINIKWFILKDSQEELIQEDSVTIKKEGSGQIVTGLLIKNGTYLQGNYRMEYTFNGGTPVPLNFTVK